MLRNNFPITAEDAALYIGFLIEPNRFCRKFDMPESAEETIKHINIFLVENGYKSVDMSEFDEENTYRNSLVTISPNPYQIEMILCIIKEALVVLKYKNLTYQVSRIFFDENGREDKLKIDFKEGDSIIDFRRKAIKYLFDLNCKYKNENYRNKWEIKLSLVLWSEDHDLDFYFDRGDTFDLLTIKHNKLGYIVNWHNLKLEREFAIDTMPHFLEFDFGETNIIDTDKSSNFIIIDDGLFNMYEIQI